MVVTHAAHGFINLTVVTLFGAVDTNGITAANINGRRTIANVTTNTYEITAGAAATSTGTGGGSNIEDVVANKARPGGHTPSYTGNPCSEMTINSCQFSNLYGDLMITERCTVTSNLFLGTSGGDKNSSVYITKNNNNVSTNRFRDDGVYPYKTGCVTLGPVKNGSGALIEQNKICNNVAILTDTESMGFLVKETRFPGAQGYEKMFGIDISGNNVKISYASTGNGGFLVNTRKATYAGQFYPFSRSKISNNICEVVNGANIEMIYVNNADTRAGNLIQNNQLKWQTAGGGRHIKAPIVDSVISGNYMQTHTAGASHGLERTQTTGLVLLTADLTTTVAVTAVADGDGLLNVLANG